MSRPERAARRPWRARAVSAAVCVGILAGVVESAWAAEPESGAGGSPLLAEVGLGAGVHGAIDERSGAVSLEVAVGGLGLAWDSRAGGANRFGLGSGWQVAGLPFVDLRGGVRVFPTKSAHTAYQADASVPSGLAGYAGDEARFSQISGALPARADGVLGERPYAFVFRELGGSATYFDGEGDPIAKVDVHGNRLDWEWARGHRLRRIVAETGVTTWFDWADPGRVGVSASAGGAAGRHIATVELSGGRVSGVVDASGARRTFEYADSGLVSRVATPSGAVTALSWQSLTDGTTAVDRIAVVDPVSGEQVAERRWEPVAGAASGWPGIATTSAVASPSADAAFQTAVTDGFARVVSSYTSGRVMTGQETLVRTPNGERLVQERRFEFPDEAAPSSRSDRPTEMHLTFADTSGRRRTVSESYRFDEFGRLVQRRSPDGTVTSTTYDSRVPDAADASAEPLVPIGLPILVRTEAPDGSVTETRHTLDDAHRAVTATETFTGRAGGELIRTDRSEFEVATDGFVTAERVFPQGGAGTPLTTEHAKVVDLAAATVTTTQTVAAGTGLAVTTSVVADLLHGGQVAATDELGRTETTTYDAVGRPIEMTDAAGRTTHIAYRARAADGVNATVTTGPDGVTVTEQHDVLGRIVRVLDNVRAGVVDDTVARVAEVRSYPTPATVVVTDAWGWSTTTEQDALGRVTRATVSSGLTQITEYDEIAGTRSTGYTMTGDLADAELVTTEHLDLNGRVTATSGMRADGLPVAGTVREYDGLGRQTHAADGTRYVYNAANRPVREITPAGDVIETAYWATGDRARVAIGAGESERGPGSVTEFYWDGATLLNDLRTEGGAREAASYVIGIAREARTLGDGPGAATVYAVHDRHGSTTELTDAAGATSARFAYSDYGAPASSGGPVPTDAPAEPAGEPAAPPPTTETSASAALGEASSFPFRFAGEYTDPTGTQHLSARTYAPDRLSFTTLDTVALQNRYGYANANPITNVDPTGHVAWADVVNGGIVVASTLFTLITAWGTLGMSLAALPPTVVFLMGAASSVGVLANLGGATLAILSFVDDQKPDLLDENTRARFTIAEYALLGVGLVTAAAVAAPKLRTMFAAQRAPVPTVILEPEMTTPLDQAVKTFNFRKWVAKRTNATGFGRRNVVYEDWMNDHPGDPQGFGLMMDGSDVALLRMLRMYDVKALSMGRANGNLFGEELREFLMENKDLITYVESSINTVRNAVIPAYRQKLGTIGFAGTEADLQVFNDLMPDLSASKDFAAIALLIAH